jgi:adenylate kinase
MPAILPNSASCPNGLQDCSSYLVSRADDNEKTIKKRLVVYNKDTIPVLSYFEMKGVMRYFEVTRGVEDADRLIDVMLGQ